MWHWYAARPNEIFVDCDNWERSRDHIRKRLMGAIESGKLFVNNVHLYPSSTMGHMHMIVVLNDIHNPTPLEKAVWAVILHSDIYRGCATVMRTYRHSHDALFASDVLIARSPLHRNPDAVCNCTGKHKYKIMADCPAALRLRGNARVESFFGKPSDAECQWF